MKQNYLATNYRIEYIAELKIRNKKIILALSFHKQYIRLFLFNNLSNMMSQIQIKEILKLSRDDKIDLVQILWDDISKDTNISDLSKSQIDELDRRLNRIDSGYSSFKPWNELKKKYKLPVRAILS